MTTDGVAEWEDGYIQTDTQAYREQYGLGDSGSGVRALRCVNDMGEPSGAYILQVRFGQDIISVRLTPAAIGRLHEQALKGGAMFTFADAALSDTSRENFREFGNGRRGS